MMKRAFDIVLAAISLLFVLPLMAVLALLIKLDSEGPVFFKQERVGRGFRPFQIYKFRTMRQLSDHKERLITIGADPRITTVGQWLRRMKLDELPQLINVLRGDMSLVGPRPEVSKYVEAFYFDYEDILTIRPGITDLASLKYSDEASLLGKVENPEEEYISHVLPDKIRLAKDYVRQSSLMFDIGVIVKTMSKLLDHRMSA